MGGLICGFGRETTCRAGCGFALARNAGDVSDGPGDGLLLGRESKGDTLRLRPCFPPLAKKARKDPPFENAKKTPKGVVFSIEML